MFAKPTKKTNAPGTKPKTSNKTKTVCVKTGVKAPLAKKGKPDIKSNKGKPPPRQDAGYSLYSTDSEDQVATAFTEMEACERILTQLKSKQKEKTTVKKKKKSETSQQPKALNDGPPVSQVPTNNEYRLPFSTALYLRHLQTQDATKNPVYNSRLISSTPDPDRLLADLSSSKLPSNFDQLSHDKGDVSAGLKTIVNANYPEVQDVPERDISVTSSVPPSQNHLRNMADMVDMYKRIELKKYQQLHEAAIMTELEKLQGRQNGNQSQDTNVTGTSNSVTGLGTTELVANLTTQGATSETSQGHSSLHGQGQVISDGEDRRQSGGFVGSGSLGFTAVDPGTTTFKPIPFDASQLSNLNSGLQGSLDLGTDGAETGLMGRGSSLTGFQPYLETTSPQVMPPLSWLCENQRQIQQQLALQAIKDLGIGNLGYTAQGQDKGQGESQVEPLKFLSDIVESDKEAQNTGRTDMTGLSHDTDYAKLPRPVSEGQSQVGLVSENESIKFTKQNGLYQIHKATKQQENITDNSSDKSKDNTSVQVIPEKDTQTSEQSRMAANSKDGVAFHSDQKDSSQNLSDLSTPRNQNSSGTSSGASQPGRVVFIPNDNSGTQNVIGYVPGIPMVTGTTPPINWPVTYEVAPDGSVLSSVTGANQGQVTMQTTSQVTPQNISGSVYPSNSQANNIAAGDIGVRKLRYLLKELKECNKVTKDVEISRLVTDIDNTVNAIPQLALTFNIHTEIELALQPLRSENSQLRRKLRLINQQLKDKEEGGAKDINFEKLHLQTSNETLQKVLKEEKEIKTRLAAEVQHVHGELHKMRVERSKMIAEVSEKETLNLKFRQETLLETQKMAHEVQMMKKEQEATVNKLEALEKENHILQITLQQRDAEIERQHELVETMKESISDLLQELDQSRSVEQGWDHNNSYGLNKLMRIMEEEGGGYSQKSADPPVRPKIRRKTPERRQFNFNSTADTSTTSSAKLTREALAHHDRKHTPNGVRLGPDGRQGPASESELDTLVELNRRGRDVSPKRTGGEIFTKPVRRRTSSSSPVRLRKAPQGGANFEGGANKEKEANYHARLRERVDNSRNSLGYELYDKKHEKQRQNERPRNRREFSKSCESSPAGKGMPMPRFSDISPDFKRLSGGKKDSSNRTEISDNQSRYSVTDYFRKYPTSSREGQSSSLDDPRSFMMQSQRSHVDRGQGQVQPLRNVHVLRMKQQTRPETQFHTSSEVGDLTGTLGNITGKTNVKQRTLFKGMHYDDTISAIPDDDQMSSVSMSSVTTANTIDDKNFRSGIATLDANIAKLQLALQKTKSMLM